MLQIKLKVTKANFKTKLITLFFLLVHCSHGISIQQSLPDFAYNISPNAYTFLLSAATMLGVSLLTVSYQSTKAALTNPVQSLQCE